MVSGYFIYISVYRFKNCEVKYYEQHKFVFYVRYLVLSQQFCKQAGMCMKCTRKRVGGGSSNRCFVIVLAWTSLSSPASHSSLCYLYVSRISLEIANVTGCELRGQGIFCPKLCQDLTGCQKRKFALSKKVVWLESRGRVLTTSSLFSANLPYSVS